MNVPARPSWVSNRSLGAWGTRSTLLPPQSRNKAEELARNLSKGPKVKRKGKNLVLVGQEPRPSVWVTAPGEYVTRPVESSCTAEAGNSFSRHQGHKVPSGHTANPGVHLGLLLPSLLPSPCPGPALGVRLARA